jgi:hypothetical protein
MKIIRHFLLGLAALFVFAACQKELSSESGFGGGFALATFSKDSLDDCVPFVISGRYVVDSTMKDSNYVYVQVKVSSPGVYHISTDLNNGFSFKDSGYFATTGLQSVKLKAVGKPVLAIPTDFQVLFDTSFCMFTVQVTKDSGTTTPVVISDYFPTSVNSYWKYTETITGDSSLMTATSKDTLIAGNTYRMFVSNSPSTGLDTFYYRKSGGSYFEYGQMDELTLGGSARFEFPFLKDNVAANTSWESTPAATTLNGFGGNAKIKFTIIANNIQTTVNGIVRDSTIQVRRDYMFAPSLTGGTLYTSIGQVDAFYVKNAGLLKVSQGSNVLIYAYDHHVF